MLSEEELFVLIKSPEESFRVEKTISTKDSKKFAEAICSFANDLPDEGKPGYLLIGVDEITNNGGLFGNAKNDFPNNNDYRNPVIATAAKVLGFVNRFGVGIQRAKRALELNGNPAPEFLTQHIGKFSVIIRKR